jgi:TrmH family RNA methyltransferase
MLSKNQKRLIASMAQKKQRNLTGLFLAEGEKTVNELLKTGFQPHLIACTEDWSSPISLTTAATPILISKDELSSASLLKTPQNVLALFKQPTFNIKIDAIKNELTLALDGIQDPGNMGTIIRLSDWFGIRHIICSDDTVDWFNPKVVQASMGGMARVKVHYTSSLSQFLEDYHKCNKTAIYGAFLEGKNIYSSPLQNTGIIVMGNEGNGIRPETAKQITEKITIPSFPPEYITSESLNVGVATAIICAEFRRQVQHY